MLRLLAAAAALLILIVLGAAATATVVFAQEAAPAVPDEGWRPMIALITESVWAGILSLVAIVGSLVVRHVPAWAQGSVKALFAAVENWTTTEAANWEPYVDGAIAKMTAFANEKTKGKGDKSEWWNYALSYLAAHNADIVAYFDQNRNGVVDALEQRMVAAGVPVPRAPRAAPEDHPAPPPSASGFMTPAAMRRARKDHPVGDL